MPPLRVGTALSLLQGGRRSSHSDECGPQNFGRPNLGNPSAAPIPIDSLRESETKSRPDEHQGVRAIHVKRTNLVINGALLEEAVRLSGERTYSRAVERALEDFVPRYQ